MILGRSYSALVEDELERTLREASGEGVGERAEYHLKAPMPGLVIAIPVSEGQDVEKGHSRVGEGSLDSDDVILHP